MNHYSQQIFEIVSKIPQSKVMTYGQIALFLGNPRLARHVGRVLSHAPEGMKLPFHRVIKSTGELAPAHVFCGEQEKLLRGEGVKFLRVGKVDLKTSLL